MKTIIELTCPKCMAQLSPEENREIMFCQYCGTKLLINDEQTHIYKHIDEAEIKKAENNKLIRLKELEMMTDDKKKKILSIILLIAIWLMITGVLFVIGIIGSIIGNELLELCLIFAILFAMMGSLCMLIPFLDQDKKNRNIVNVGKGVVKISSSIACFSNKHYEVEESLLRQAGFTNIKLIALKDLNSFSLKKNGMVAGIIINGEDDFDEGDVFPKDANIIITYHSVKD